jgi:hypothetical protein
LLNGSPRGKRSDAAIALALPAALARALHTAMPTNAAGPSQGGRMHFWLTTRDEDADKPGDQEVSIPRTVDDALTALHQMVDRDVFRVAAFAYNKRTVQVVCTAAAKEGVRDEGPRDERLIVRLKAIVNEAPAR